MKTMGVGIGHKHGHQHGEAFCLMTYYCGTCSRRERLWNSRDGVTPFGIHCPDCAAIGEEHSIGMAHVDWATDRYAPDYRPYVGQRIFRDGTVAEARRFMRQRLERCKGTPYELPESEWPALIERAVTATEGEFRPGWPMLDIFGVNVEALSDARGTLALVLLKVPGADWSGQVDDCIRRLDAAIATLEAR